MIKARRQSSRSLKLYLCSLLLVLVLGSVFLNLQALHSSQFGSTTSNLTTRPLPIDAQPRSLSASSSNVSHTQEKNGDREPLLEILRHGDVDLTEELIHKLPTWQEVTDKFGDRPKVMGLETCEAFRQTVPLKDRSLAPAGPFNSGTNIFYYIMGRNCKGVDISGQVNWGKHQSPRFRLENYVYEEVNENYMPVVMVRDPYTWLQSMCRKGYSTSWYHVGGEEGHCPNLVPSEVEKYWFHKKRPFIVKHFGDDENAVHSVVVKANFTLDKASIPVRIRYKSEVAYHESLAHFWKDWYQEYYDADFPRLMVRLEDLVFFPYEVVKSTCECIGGTVVPHEEFSIHSESVKKGADGHDGAAHTDLASSFSLHIHANRTKGMTPEDTAFARSVLGTSPVMQYFGYKYP
eukprot:Nitzschia sp. Nitz4//scaffold10_size219509//78115//79405//NITZ4_001419-RA/size219509-augustus-gene-0.270-mRNA-1//-1//CDS//3329532893//1967//frame0